MTLSENGKILLVSKQKGVSSYSVIRKAKRHYPGEKIGHTGTLDPKATGLLILLIGKETKKANTFLALDKTYIACIVFGYATDTYDTEGRVTRQAYSSDQLSSITRKSIQEKLQTSFSGEILQSPPIFSAIKLKGRPLYAYARKGDLPKEYTPRKRAITIYDTSIRGFTPYDGTRLPQVKIQIHCSKGTYIRSIAHDLGMQLKVPAYMKELTRTHIGSYSLVDAVNSEEL